MNTMEIVLLIMGFAIFVASFIIPEIKNQLNPDVIKDERETIQALISKEIDGIKYKIEDAVDESITYAIEKTERSLERISNEKIMAVNEYSDTVLAEINKNHQEVIFLYEMLNDKHENLKTTVTEVTNVVKEAEQVVKDTESLAIKNNKAAISAEKVNRVQKKPIKELQTPEQGVSIEENVDKKSKKTQSSTDAKSAIEVNEFTPMAFEKLEKVPAKSKKKPNSKPTVDISFAGNGENGLNNNDLILNLHEKGKSNMAIARELGLGIGEVKLVIDLYEGI